MIEHLYITAIIPARGGSKRLPKKNIKHLCGKPLIAWTIETALSSKYIDDIIVSTDSEEIKIISEHYGAKVPFLRPCYLSTDTATAYDSIEHAINFLKINQSDHLVIILQPTSPLRKVEEIDSGLEFFVFKKASGVVSVSQTEPNPLWSAQLPEDDNMSNFIKPELVTTRSQDLPVFYHLNGSFYIFNAKKLLEKQKIFYDETVFAFKTDVKTSIDIDTDFDFKIAQALMEVENESIHY